MKKIVSLIAGVSVMASVLCVPVYAEEVSITGMEGDRDTIILTCTGELSNVVISDMNNNIIPGSTVLNDDNSVTVKPDSRLELDKVYKITADNASQKYFRMKTLYSDTFDYESTEELNSKYAAYTGGAVNTDLLEAADGTMYIKSNSAVSAILPKDIYNITDGKLTIKDEYKIDSFVAEMNVTIDDNSTNNSYFGLNVKNVGGVNWVWGTGNRIPQMTVQNAAQTWNVVLTGAINYYDESYTSSTNSYFVKTDAYSDKVRTTVTTDVGSFEGTITSEEMNAKKENSWSDNGIISLAAFRLGAAIDNLYLYAMEDLTGELPDKFEYIYEIKENNILTQKSIDINFNAAINESELAKISLFADGVDTSNKTLSSDGKTVTVVPEGETFEYDKVYTLSINNVEDVFGAYSITDNKYFMYDSIFYDDFKYVSTEELNMVWNATEWNRNAVDGESISISENKMNVPKRNGLYVYPKTMNNMTGLDNYTVDCEIELTDAGMPRSFYKFTDNITNKSLGNSANDDNFVIDIQNMNVMFTNKNKDISALNYYKEGTYPKTTWLGSGFSAGDTIRTVFDIKNKEIALNLVYNNASGTVYQKYDYMPCGAIDGSYFQSTDKTSYNVKNYRIYKFRELESAEYTEPSQLFEINGSEVYPQDKYINSITVKKLSEYYGDLKVIAASYKNGVLTDANIMTEDNALALKSAAVGESVTLTMNKYLSQEPDMIRLFVWSDEIKPLSGLYTAYDTNTAE